MKPGWETAIYPKAVWVPWQGTAFYRDQNRPIATVLHIVQGWAHVYRQWAEAGHHRASVHFVVARNGTVYQFLYLKDGGYHAGITTAQGRSHPPTWPLWRGTGQNVNHYTVGIEHEGFYDQFPWPKAQQEASRELCLWICDQLEVPFTRERFPAHAEIDRVNRVNDFASPANREIYYRWLFSSAGGQQKPEEPMGMTDEERERFDALVDRVDRAEQLVAGWAVDTKQGERLTGEAALVEAATRQISAIGSVQSTQRAQAGLRASVAELKAAIEELVPIDPERAKRIGELLQEVGKELVE